jgi:hypothetical protein
MDIAWYRDLAITIVGFLLTLGLIVLLVIMLALYFRARKILQGAQKLERKIEDFAEYRLSGTKMGMVLGSLGTAIGQRFTRTSPETKRRSPPTSRETG